MINQQMPALELGSKGYSCAQMLIIGALRLLKRENPDLTRALGGLAQGAGCGELCGALSGGVCLLSLYTGKGWDAESPDPKVKLLIHELTEWFALDVCNGKGVTCDAILATVTEGDALSAQDKQRMCENYCIGLVIKVWEKSLSLLQRHGFDLTRGREPE